MCLCPRSCCCWVKSLYTIFNFKMYHYSTEACNVIMPVIINNGSSRLHGHLMSQGHALKFESLVELWRVSQTSEEEPKSLGISSVRLLLGFFRGLKWHIYPKETIKVQLHLLSKKKIEKKIFHSTLKLFQSLFLLRVPHEPCSLISYLNVTYNMLPLKGKRPNQALYGFCSDRLYK